MISVTSTPVATDTINVTTTVIITAWQVLCESADDASVCGVCEYVYHDVYTIIIVMYMSDLEWNAKQLVPV